MSPLLDCPEIKCWQALLDVNLPAEMREQYQHHLDSCPACQDRIEHGLDQDEELLRLARLVGDPTARPADLTLSRALEGLHQAKFPGWPAPARPVDLYFLRPADRPEVLGTLGPYEIVEVIGQGGMGVVLKGYEPALRRFVAIKVLSSSLAGNAVARKRFTREARSAAAVCHEHIVPVYGVAETDGLPYLVCQYVAGESLQSRLDRTGPLEVGEIVRIGLQTALGLAAAHAKGLIHRDIKPANLLLSFGRDAESSERSAAANALRSEDSASRLNGFTVKITDFGLARSVDDVGLTQKGVVAGTPEYMAPEQARGESVDHRADLFSLGSVLYAMCTGQPPFRGSTAVSVLRQVSDHEADSVRSVSPAVPEWLDALIARLMAKNPADRFQSAAEVAALLENYLAHLRQPDLAVPDLPTQVAAGFTEPTKVPERTSFTQSVRRFWMPALVLLAALGPVIAFQLAGGGDDRAVMPKSGSEYHEYHVPLGGRPENLPRMRLVGPDAQQCVRFEPTGLRITLAPGYQGHRPQVGLSTGIVLRGDFEITVSFEILKDPEPEDAEDSTPLSLWVYRLKEDKCITGLSRRVTVNQGPQFAAYAALFDSSVGKTTPTMGEAIPTDAKTGRLRMVRIGGEASYYVSEGSDPKFTLLTQFVIGEKDLDDLRLIAFTGGPRASLDGRFSDLSIRMGTLPRLPPAPIMVRASGWLGAVLLMAALPVSIGLVVFLWRKRSRTEVPLGTTAENDVNGMK